MPHGALVEHLVERVDVARVEGLVVAADEGGGVAARLAFGVGHDGSQLTWALSSRSVPDVPWGGGLLRRDKGRPDRRRRWSDRPDAGSSATASGRTHGCDRLSWQA